MTVPYIFASATAPLPLSQLDSNFATAITLGSTSLTLGSTVTSVAGLTLTSPTITGGTSTATQNLANVTGTLAVGNGGTGLSTLTAGYIPYGNNTSALGSSANLFWDSANSRLGIGTSSPGSKLNVVSEIRVSDATTGTSSGLVTGIGSGNAYISNQYNGYLLFGTNNTEQMRIDSSGNVGIGTSSPSFSLQVQKSGDSRIAIVSTSGSNTAVTQYSTNNGSTYWYNYYNGSSFIFQDNALERMRIDSSGNLGVGTTSPAALLDVWGSGKSILVGGTASNNIPAQLSTALYLSGAYDASNKRSYRMYVDGNGALNFDTTGSYAYANLPSSGTYANKMTLDTSGNLLVGQTSSGLQNSLSYALQTDGNFRISHTSGTASGSSYASFGYGAGTAIGSITQNGSTGVLYNLTSDYRLKNNPTALTGASEFIMALQPKTWDWWDGSGKGVGFIAHEFMEVAKYSGNGTKDEVDAEGKPKYQSIQPSSSEVMANLVALVQEQQVIIEQLKAKVGI